MTEHPIIKLMALAIIKRDGEDPAHWKGNVPVSTAALTTALQWLSDPENLSDDVVEDVANRLGTFLPDMGSHIRKELSEIAITALANALLKEIEGQ